MRKLTWSVTRSRRWNQCRRAYFYRYVVNATPASPPNRERGYGILVHLGLEHALRAALTHVGRGDGMRRYLDHAAEAIAADGRGDQALRNAAITAVARVLDVMPEPAPAAVLGVEMPFTLPTAPHRAIEGVIDYAIRTGPTSAHIRDWKSGAVDPDPATLRSDPQAGVYYLAGQRMWPWARTITVGLYSVLRREETLDALTFDGASFFAERLDHEMTTAEALERNVRVGTVASHYPVNPGKHCVGCPFRAYCPEHAANPGPIVRDLDIVAEQNRITAALVNRV